MSRQVRQGATLTLVFGVVLLGGALAGAWGEPEVAARTPAQDAAPGAAGPGLAGARLSRAEAERLLGASGDRWAAYYSPQEYADFLLGRYLGVGLSIGRSGDGSTAVSQVRPAGPAAAAGVEVGDRLVRLDGVRADRLPVTEVVARLRGEGAQRRPGSTVSLAVQRADGPVREVVLRRAVLETQEVTVGELAPGVVRIGVAAFTDGVAERVRAAARGARAVVLDLRGSSGGLVEEAAETAGVFLDGGEIGSYQAGGERRGLTAAPGGDTATPLVVLVDGGTMSAAELLAGALQDRCRAVLIGSRTFGKGTVQQPSRLADGSVLELTVGRYQTPAGRSPDGTGFTPDVPVPTGERAETLALRVLAGLGRRG
ncbi:Putative peptidase S41 family protein [Kitasatospora sp. MMS16-BH015]|uniref:S41 family peptidase n=1 Tax=Kitasatospora sp. MMS16-BH015 TaxID=2018025 RepID=UPI000CA0C01C|nr:S41 family peptidase [Kitasatospora sp. MMS16-BH015]AUG77512.1 Putative peptidase S41 family protein [Kitasatospora sp. MMS16-BH015]